MVLYNDIYNRNKKLDDIFMNKYFNIESKYYEKNCLELIVELCELANETKCFKYWTVKKPDKELVLEERRGSKRFSTSKEESVIEWNQIVKIGDDIILVDTRNRTY